MGGPPNNSEYELIRHGVYDSVDAAMTSLVLSEVEIVCAAHDACYSQVKARYDVFPSARASQAIAKCRKKHGNVRHGKAGKNLKRWERKSGKIKLLANPADTTAPAKSTAAQAKKFQKKLPKCIVEKRSKERFIKSKAGSVRTSTLY